MADITIRLIIYRLGETYTKMAEIAGSVYANMTWENYILDILLLAWLAWAALVVVVVNLIVHFFGPFKLSANERWVNGHGTHLPALIGSDASDGPNLYAKSPLGQPEKSYWLNAMIDWFYKRVDTSPLFVDAWILALNEQARKLGVSYFFINSGLKSNCCCT